MARSSAARKTQPQSEEKELSRARKMALFYAEESKEIENDLTLVSNTIKEPERLSTGVLVLDWICGGGKVPGLVIVAGEEASGKCLVGETIVNTNEGFVELQEFIHDDGFKKVDLSISTHQGLKKVSHTYRDVSSTIGIKTINGFEVRGTPEHQVMVLNSSLEFEWKRLENITKADWLAIAPSHATALYGNSDVDINLASIMGYLTANGKSSRMHSLDKEVRRRFTEAAIALTGVAPTATDESLYLRTTSNRHADTFKRKYLKPFAFSGGKASKKNIPYIIRTAPKEVLHEFLEAYFECDCHVDGSYIKISSASKKLIDQLHVILLQGYDIFGYKCSFKASAANSNKPKVRTYYGITITGPDTEKFINAFKRSKVQWAASRLTNSSINQGGSSYRVVPYVRAAVMEAYETAKVSNRPGDSRVTGEDGNIISNFWKPDFIKPCYSGRTDNHYASIGLFNRVDWNEFIPHLAKIDSDLADKLRVIAESGFRYEQPASIETFEKEVDVYDVSVPGLRAFLAGGVVSHNSTQLFHSIAQAHGVFKLPTTKLWDAEGSTSPKYAGNILQPFDLDLKTLMTPEGRKEGFYYFRNNVIERMFDYLKRTLSQMPDKNWVSQIDSWAYFFPKRDDVAKRLMQAMEVKADKTLSAGGDFYVCPTDYGGPEGLFAVDSFASLLTKAEEQKEDSDKGKRSALEASAFSEHLKRVKVDLFDKKIIMQGTNQLGSHVRQQYGSPEDQLYEKGGNALKFYSDERSRTFSRSPSNGAKWGPFTWDKDNAKFGIEESVEAKGTDRYAYKEAKNTKNKFGKPGLKAPYRVWVSDAEGKPRGIDPVFDTWVHLRNTGQLGKSGNAFVFKLKPSVGAKRAAKMNALKPFKFPSFKKLVVAEYTNNIPLLKEALKELGADFRPDLRMSLFKQMRENEEDVYSNIRDSSKTEADEMEDADTSEDYENI